MKGVSSMITQRSNPAPAARANGREMLYQKAKRYQLDHPGTDLMAALKVVSDDVLPANAVAAEGGATHLHMQ
jgi:hypothetical protein